MNAREFHHRLAVSLSRCLGDNKSIVCAVSGGIDSVVMLHALHEVNRRKRLGLALMVGHVDHGLRPDSADVATWVEHLARRMELPCTVQRIRVPALARRRSGSIEEIARDARYAALERMATDAGATCIAVAHHADDQAETVLHHMIRGTGLAGLQGMPPVRPVAPGSRVFLVRPMLEFARPEIETYATEQGLKHREDTTNRDTSLTRNRIRHSLLPLLRQEFNPRVVEALVRLAAHASAGAELVSDCAQALLLAAAWVREDGLVQMDVASLKCTPQAVTGEALRMLLVNAGALSRDLDYERILAVQALLDGDGRRRTIELPGRACAQRRGKFIFIGAASAFDTPKRSKLSSSGKRPRRAARSPR